MKLIRPQFGEHDGPHLSEAELFDLQQGRLSAAQLAEVRQHLFGCPHCLQAFKELSAFFTPPQAGEPGVSDEQIETGWSGLKERLPRLAANSPAAHVTARTTVASPAGRWLLPLAAGLLVTLGLAGLFVWRGQRETQIAQTPNTALQPTAQPSPAARVRPPETAAEQKAAGGQAQPNTAQAPSPKRATEPPFPAGELLVTSSEKAAGDAAPALSLFVPAQEKNFSLKLRIYNPLGYRSFRVELLDSQRQVVRTAQGKLNQGLSIEAIFQRTGLADGKYFLRVTGSRAQARSVEPLESVVEITSRRN